MTSAQRASSTRQFLFNEDCIDGMAKLDAGAIDVVVTSPPYNLGVRYGKYRDDQPRESYLLWMDEWAEAVKRVLHDDGSLFLNVGSKPTDPLVPFQVLQVMGGHFKLQNVIHWIKSIAIEKSRDWRIRGHYTRRGRWTLQTDQQPALC